MTIKNKRKAQYKFKYWSNYGPINNIYWSESRFVGIQMILEDGTTKTVMCNDNKEQKEKSS